MKKTIIIAEVGPNHNGSLKIAKRFVDIISKSGADFIKFQTSIPSDHISKYASKAKYQKKNTKNYKETQLEMAKNISLKYDEFIALYKYCKKKKIKFLTTAFGLKSLSFIKKFNMDYLKIPSGELNNFEYLKKIPIPKKNMKILLSTGMSTIKEISETVNFLKKKRGINKNKIILMQCTSSYPVPYTDTNLNAITYLKKKFKLKVGFSDHTLGTECAIAAVSLGAEYIEKHVTFNNKLKGPDHKSSLTLDKFKNLVAQIRNIEKALGDGKKKVEKSEKQNRIIARNSIIAKTEIKKNEKFSYNNIMVKRPGNGIPAKYFIKLIGKRSNKNYLQDQLIKMKV